MAAWKRLALVVTSTLVVLGLLAGPAAADEAADETQFVQLINQSRSASGLAPLTMNPQLIPGARAHSGTMAQEGTIFHNPALSRSVSDNWMRLGENVGVGGSVHALHDAFMSSPGHRANVLGDYDRVGIGIVMSGPVMFVTEVFWKTAPALEPLATASAAQASASAGKTKSVATKRRAKGRKPGHKSSYRRTTRRQRQR